ncbi:SH3 domain-containing protein [Exiguobacterium qingdaonense]|uniref:SH3 domain-containing protein n=1 Tax=Exiguobacterium qingdaonense TaxID=2751251 RepID=UPI001BE89EAB|nr:SH3 domain-containing protein [Exiguobacterium qingdaonense]
MNGLKSSWSLKLLLSSSLALSGAAIVPYQLDSSGIKSTAVEAASTYTTTANLNLRLSAATWSPILLTIPSGSSVTYVSTYGSWYKVSYGGKTGYVSSQYVNVSNTSNYYKTTDRLNMRLTAASWSDVITVLPANATVKYVSRYGSWYKVTYNGKTGYVASSFLTPTSAPIPPSDYYKTNVNLNMRLTAASWSDVVTTIPSGATVKYVSRYGSWYKVTFNGKTGYVASEYLTGTTAPITPSSHYKTTVNLNMRLSAASWSSVLTVIPSGATVKYVSRYDSWYKVTFNGKTGYVASEYLKPTTVTTPTDTTGSGKTVVIDAGHGGNDPGAVYGSVYEKVIALDIAKRLAGVLSSTYDYNVKMTRSNDTYLSLQERVSLNKSYKADAFVSLHANASVYNTAHGHEVLVPTSDHYTTNPYISASRSLGALINKELASRISTIQNRGVKYQNVYVVGRNVTPSTLVEYGFISNSSDRAHLTSTTYRQRMAEATASGIHQFMRSYY